MGRVSNALATMKAAQDEAVEAEVERMDFRPDDIPADVWAMMEENGRLATERLRDILASPRFMRYKPGDQAKLIALAQNRIYGMPKSNSGAKTGRGGSLDVTQNALNDLVNRATLPEYRRIKATVDIDDAEEI